MGMMDLVITQVSAVTVIYGNHFDLFADSWQAAKSSENVHIVFYENMKVVGVLVIITLG